MELNCDWTDDFEQEEHLFNDFYKEPVQNLTLYCFYVNKNRELFYIKKDNLPIEDGILKKERLIYQLKKNLSYNNIKFQLLSILKYNINISPQDVIFFLKDANPNNFLSIEKNINSIRWEDTITLFQDMNSIIFVYNEKKPSRDTTKKIYIGKKRRKSRTKS